MRVKLICVGKNNVGFVEAGMVEYAKRIKKYIHFEITFTKAWKKSKSTDENIVKNKEGEQILKLLNRNDYAILLDEKGELFSSVGFSTFIDTRLSRFNADVVFIVGGAMGFSKDLYERSDARVSLSKMTFPHQLVRVLFLEQLYRAFTIIKNEPYHNE